MTVLRILFAVTAVLALTACAGERRRQLGNPAPCPSASVLSDASRLVNIQGEQRLANVGFTAEILGVRSLCEYENDGGPIESDLEIDFAFGKGAAAQGYSHTYRYFVAVTRRDSVVIEKQTFAIQPDFGSDTVVYAQDELNRIVIPRADDSVSGENFEIIVGFELTEDQLAFNRSGVRFRAGSGDLGPSGS